MKKLIIMRGLPGSGKSTLAKKQKGVICSADDYFTDMWGRYHFDAAKLPYAHFECRRKAYRLMREGISTVVIDNTNIYKSNSSFYVESAQEFGYTVEYLSPTTPWAWDPVECFKKCKHGVPLEVIKGMKDKFEII